MIPNRSSKYAIIVSIDDCKHERVLFKCVYKYTHLQYGRYVDTCICDKTYLSHVQYMQDIISSPIYSFSHNHGSVDNCCILKELLLEMHPFLTSIIVGGRVTPRESHETKTCENVAGKRWGRWLLGPVVQAGRRLVLRTPQLELMSMKHHP